MALWMVVVSVGDNWQMFQKVKKELNIAYENKALEEQTHRKDSLAELWCYNKIQYVA